MSAVLAWVKSNIFTLIFILVMVAALSVLPIVSKNLNATVRSEAEERARKTTELAGLEKTQFAPPTAGTPAEPQSLLVNESLLRRYEEVTTVLREDAEKVREAALTLNRQGRTVLLDQLFPEPPPAMREVLPQRFYDLLVGAYEDLLDEIDAGMPPPPEEMQKAIERRRAQFLTTTAAKDSADDLTEEERKRLEEVLAKERLSRYAEAADKIGVYASLNELEVPWFDPTRLPATGEMFNWHWKFWITQDVLRAIAAANQSDGSVARAPVKRVMWVRPWPPEWAASPSAGGRPAGGRSGGGGIMGSGGGGGASSLGGGGGGAAHGGGAPAAGDAAGGPPNPAGKAPTDYAVSFTGRKSNPLYDVVTVEVAIVVDSARLPEVMDALARQNFMTVLDVKLMPTMPHEAMKEGFFYGQAPVSTVELTLETVWLREWTTPFMPDGMKSALGIPIPGSEPAQPQT